MSTPPLTPGETATADQLPADANAYLDTLIAGIRTGDEAAGEAQNLADFTAYLSSEHAPASLAALLVIAARRIGETS